MAEPRVSKADLDLVWARDVSRCFRCWRPLVRYQPPYSVHHRRAAGMGGSKNPVTRSPANLLLLCGTGTTGCHGWIESNREAAYGNGWLVRSWADPREVPVYFGGRFWVYLTMDGEMVGRGVNHDHADGGAQGGAPLRLLPQTEAIRDADDEGLRPTAL